MLIVNYCKLKSSSKEQTFRNKAFKIGNSTCKIAYKNAIYKEKIIKQEEKVEVNVKLFG